MKMERIEGLKPELDPNESEHDFFVLHLMTEAMIAFNDREVFGDPILAGHREQEVWWCEAILCVRSAKHLADDESRKKKVPRGEQPPDDDLG